MAGGGEGFFFFLLFFACFAKRLSPRRALEAWRIGCARGCCHTGPVPRVRLACRPTSPRTCAGGIAGVPGRACTRPSTAERRPFVRIHTARAPARPLPPLQLLLPASISPATASESRPSSRSAYLAYLVISLESRPTSRSRRSLPWLRTSFRMHQSTGTLTGDWELAARLCARILLRPRLIQLSPLPPIVPRTMRPPGIPCSPATCPGPSDPGSMSSCRSGVCTSMCADGFPTTRRTGRPHLLRGIGSPLSTLCSACTSSSW